jgi:hypothetical protein
MLDLVFALAGGTFLLGAVALAVRVELEEARAASGARPGAPRHPRALPIEERKLRLVRFEG